MINPSVKAGQPQGGKPVVSVATCTPPRSGHSAPGEAGPVIGPTAPAGRVTVLPCRVLKPRRRHPLRESVTDGWEHPSRVGRRLVRMSRTDVQALSAMVNVTEYVVKLGFWLRAGTA